MAHSTDPSIVLDLLVRLGQSGLPIAFFALLLLMIRLVVTKECDACC